MFFKKKINFILAIESSCDETSVAIIKKGPFLLSNIVISQVKIHKLFGGVVPEIASRDHVKKIIFCIDCAIKKAKINIKNIDAIAVTYGPGLIGSLLIGITAAKTISLLYNLPLIAINHIIGHIYSVSFDFKIKVPFLSLVISGGHTELIYFKNFYKYKIIGETLDDAVGEVYDKIGRILNLKYPAGKEIDKRAGFGKIKYKFPFPMLYSNNLNFSFSGLKSSVVDLVLKYKKNNIFFNSNDIFASFQYSVINVLFYKVIKACKYFKDIKQLIIVGGVSSNIGIRNQFIKNFNLKFPNIKLIFPRISLCCDNAAMIGAAAFEKIKKLEFENLNLMAMPNLKI